MVVDVSTCRLTMMVVTQMSGLREVSRRKDFCDLAGSSKGLVINLRGHGVVEVYDARQLQLWYDGFQWHGPPYDVLWGYLLRFYRSEESEERQVDAAKRILGSVIGLIDRGASSILVFTTRPGWKALTEKPDLQGKPVLEHVNRRRRVEFVLEQDALDIKDHFPLDALVGLLQSDGAHVLLNDRTVAGACYVVSDDPATPTDESNGTGTQAAQRASRGLKGVADGLATETFGFVVKVSADRQVHVYVRGDEMFTPPKPD
jgi:hypothetical protein